MRLLQVDEDNSAGHDTHLALALAVVRQAMRDCVVRRHQGCRNVDRTSSQAIAEEARDFLLRRLWEPGNPYGEILHANGIHTLTSAQLSREVRIGDRHD